jgi:hypothetical protein
MSDQRHIPLTKLRNLASARGFELQRVREEHSHRKVLYRDTRGRRRYVELYVRPGAVAGWLVRELDDTRRILDAAATQRVSYFRCSCGTYLTRDGRRPTVPSEADPEVLTLGIGVCDACRGTPWDATVHYIDGESAGETRSRIGELPAAQGGAV